MREGAPLVTAYVAVGSSIDPIIVIPAALDLLEAQVRVTARSALYRSASVGHTETVDPPHFHNAVWQVETTLSAGALRDQVFRPIEARLGRVRTADRNAPRPIDLDLVVHDGTVIDPSINLYPFVRVPLLEVAPDLVLVGSGRLADQAPGYSSADVDALTKITESTSS